MHVEMVDADHGRPVESDSEHVFDRVRLALVLESRTQQSATRVLHLFD